MAGMSYGVIDLIPRLFSYDAGGNAFTTEIIEMAKEIYHNEGEVSYKNCGKIVKQNWKAIDEERVFKERVRKAIGNFNQSGASQLAFAENFQEWSFRRRKTIDALNEVADDIKSEKFNCNAAAIAGTSLRIVGEVIGLIGCIASSANPKLKDPMDTASALFVGAGTATNVGSTLVEVTLLKHRLETVENILKADEDGFEGIKKWIQRPTEIAEIVEDYIGFELMTDLTGQITNLYNDYTTNRRKFERTLKPIVSSLVKKINVKFITNASHGRANMDLSLGVSLGSVIPLIQMISSFVLWQEKHSLGFNLIARAVECRDAVNAVVGLVSGSEVKFRKKSAEQMLRSIAVDVVNVAMMAADADDESLSKHATSIKQIAKVLETELDIGKAMYRALPCRRTNNTLW